MYLSNKIKLTSLWTLMVAAVTLFSCSKDRIGETRGSGEPGAVTLNIYTPTSSVPKSKNQDADECAIDAVKVLVFSWNGANYIYDYMTDGQQIIQDQTDTEYSTFKAKLTSSDVALKLLLVANYNDVFDTEIIPASATVEQVRTLLTDTFDPEMEGRLPLYGETEMPNGLKADEDNYASVTMLRAIARVDVINDIDPGFSKSFEIERVYIYRANEQMKLVADDASFADNTTLSVKAPSVPGSSVFRTDAYYKDIENGETDVTKIYVPESVAVTDANEQLQGATCIVVGGYFDGSQTLSYYRIDFNPEIDGHPFGQILRNYKYIFNIKQVNGTGWPGPDEAANNKASLITATMQIWNEATSEMYFCGDGNYLGISSRHIVMPYYKDAKDTVYLQTTVPFQIQMTEEDGTPTGSAISNVGQSLTGDFYTLTIAKETQNGEDVYQLLLVTTGDNRTDENFVNYFQVTTASWTFDVTIEQETFKTPYRNKFIHVLTITGLPGDLGTAEGTFTANSGSAMRRVLDNPAYFSPDGTIPCAGIVVHSFPNSMISSSLPDPMYLLEKMLQHMDVVHIAGEGSPSPEAAALIYNWLKSKYYHTLILGTDTETSNENLVDLFPEKDAWYNSTLATAIGTIDYNDPWEYDLQTPFFEGLFGNVPHGASPFGFVDGNIGYNNGFTESTIPILRVTAGLDTQGMLTHGVDTESGLFYFGESQVFTSKGYAMSQAAETSGTIESEFDVLMANIWAWIVERVVIGKE